jgi:hypothetical protein
LDLLRLAPIQANDRLSIEGLGKAKRVGKVVREPYPILCLFERLLRVAKEKERKRAIAKNLHGV